MAARSFATAASLLLMTSALSGCNLFTRLAEIGTEPQMSQISNPQVNPNYRPVSLPMPAPQIAEINPNSLWRPGAKAFFKDIRAKDVGDMVTVRLTLDDEAKLENKTTRGRDDAEAMSIDNLLGYQAHFGKLLPKEYNNSGELYSFGTKHNTDGNGKIDRSEEIKVECAALVTQILPNGAMVILGRQEIRVNYELRELAVTGVVRPQDIEADNSVNDEKIAELRVAYGGRGTLSDLQQPRWGTQMMDILLPF